MMGTRADFYVGRGEDAEWLGSIGLDGYPMGIDPNILACNNEQVYRDFVALFLKSRDDATLPAMGWPWPWENSLTTDYAYAFDDGKVYAACFGYFWFEADQPEPDEDERPDLWKTKKCVFPDMSDIQSVTLGPRSGLLVVKLT